MEDHRILSRSPDGSVEHFYYDEATDRMTIVTEQDVTDMVERMKASYASTDQRTRFGGDGGPRHVGQIPMPILMELIDRCRTQELDFQQVIRDDWLNNPSYRAFRSRPGVV